MDEKRIEQIAREAHEMDGTLRDAFLWAIITAINETKEEDANICKARADGKYSGPGEPMEPEDVEDYCCADDIIASKVKP